jgi:hypothetical protein
MLEACMLEWTSTTILLYQLSKVVGDTWYDVLLFVILEYYISKLSQYKTNCLPVPQLIVKRLKSYILHKTQ